MAKKFSAAKGLAAGFLGGALVSILGTVMHQTLISGFPFGLMLALSLAFWLSIRLRSAPGKSTSWTFALTLAVLLTVFAQEADDVMIPATELGYFWSYGAIGIGVLMAAFPRLSRDTWKTKS
jgi:hypothetical protein